MLREKCTVDEMITYLDNLVKTDKNCITRLMQLRMVCNADMEDHPTCPIGDEGGKSVLGLLGIINGFYGFQVDDDPSSAPIAMDINKETNEVVGFKLNKPAAPITS